MSNVLNDEEKAQRAMNKTNKMENRLLSTTDAVIWARSFCSLFSVQEYAPIKSSLYLGDDVELMTAWFANAIEVGRNAEQATVRNMPIKEVLEAVIKRVSAAHNETYSEENAETVLHLRSAINWQQKQAKRFKAEEGEYAGTGGEQ